MNLNDLTKLPAGVTETNALIDRFDACLYVGFARLATEHRKSLGVWAATFSGSPLQEAISDAVAAVGRSEFVIRHFLAMAAARAALQGAQYGALRDQLMNVLGKPCPDIDEPQPASPGTSATALSSAQQWLMEVALAGFHHLEEDSIAPFWATLENIQADVELTGLAALLTGFVNELLAHMPTERQESLPVFRWADLWTAAMIRTQQLPGATIGQTVSGVLVPLGVDLQSHENFAAATVYGLLETNGEYQTVRIPFASYKVDAIAGAEVWELFGDVGSQVLKALESHKTLKVDNAELRSNGDLILKSKPRLGRASDPFAVSEHLRPLPAKPALMRHPVQLGEVVVVPGQCDLPLATERLTTETGLTEELLQQQSLEQIALLRFDGGGWRLQPLCVKGENTTVISGEGIAKTRAQLKSKTLAILRERSSKLLRGT